MQWQQVGVWIFVVPLSKDGYHGWLAKKMFQVKWSKIPRNSIEVVRLMTFLLTANIGSFKGMLSFWQNAWRNVYFVFPSLNDSLLALNQTAILFSSRFTLLKRALMLLWDEKRFVSLANIFGCRILETL